MSALGAALDFPYFSRRLVWSALVVCALGWTAAATTVGYRDASGMAPRPPAAVLTQREAGRPALQGGVVEAAERTGADAPAAPPSWVQAIRAGSVWSASAGGERVARVAQWQFLRVVGAEQGRLRIVAAAESDGLSGEAWIDLEDVGLSGSPPEWGVATRTTELYAAASGNERVGLLRDGQPVMLAGATQADRTRVYVPGQGPDSSSIGYAWVDAGLLKRSEGPPGMALPSPVLKLPGRAEGTTYRVRPGDTISSIATEMGIASADLLKLNGIEGAPGLIVGQILRATRSDSAAQPEGPRRVREAGPGWVSADYAVVIDGESGQVLWARDAYTPVAPASLTKIVTALVTLDHARLSDTVRVRVDSRLLIDSTVMGIYPGEELSVEDLLYGLMLPSGNDAALALAEHVAGTQEGFIQLMTAKARSLGLTGSTFTNPHGLDALGHQSTAYDMAMLARVGLRDSVFRALSAARTYETPRGKGYQLYNLNALLWRYTGADGVKIGYTDAAGRAIVGSATRNGHRVIVAAIRSADIYADSAALLEWAFSSYEW